MWGNFLFSHVNIVTITISAFKFKGSPSFHRLHDSLTFGRKYLDADVGVGQYLASYMINRILD